MVFTEIYHFGREKLRCALWDVGRKGRLSIRGLGQVAFFLANRFPENTFWNMVLGPLRPFKCSFYEENRTFIIILIIELFFFGR